MDMHYTSQIDKELKERLMYILQCSERRLNDMLYCVEDYCRNTDALANDVFLGTDNDEEIQNLYEESLGNERLEMRLPELIEFEGCVNPINTYPLGEPVEEPLLTINDADYANFWLQATGNTWDITVFDFGESEKELVDWVKEGF